MITESEGAVLTTRLRFVGIAPFSFFCIYLSPGLYCRIWDAFLVHCDEKNRTAWFGILWNLSYQQLVIVDKTRHFLLLELRKALFFEVLSSCTEKLFKFSTVLAKVFHNLWKTYVDKSTSPQPQQPCGLCIF